MTQKTLIGVDMLFTWIDKIISDINGISFSISWNIWKKYWNILKYKQFARFRTNVSAIQYLLISKGSGKYDFTNVI